MKNKIVDIDTIIERTKQYGNNFPILVDLWNNFLQTKLDVNIVLQQSDVAIMLSLLKVSRLSITPTDEDTLRDLLNYMWIGLNYEEYVKLAQNNNSNFNSPVNAQTKNNNLNTTIL